MPKARPCVIDGNTAVELAADADAVHRVRRDRGRRQRLGDRRGQRLLPHARVLLGPARLRKARLIGGARRADGRQPRIGHHDLQALRADVDAEEHRASPDLPQQQRGVSPAGTWP